MSVRILSGDCRDVLKTLPEASIQCCVTSPPYWGLRSYLPEGHADKHMEIGSESTLQEWVDTMVAVFREVRRVLRPDGTLFLNLGDAYAGSGRGGNIGNDTSGLAGKQPDHSRVAGRAMTQSARRDNHEIPRSDDRVDGLKPKDLMGQPWRVAFALQQPWYAGRIASAMDREWLAAMVDAEGCMFIHKRKAGSASGARFERSDGSTANYVRVNDTFSAGMEVCNTHVAIVERCMRIAGVGSVSTQEAGRRQKLYRWTVRADEARQIVRELYPHLVAKQHQARVMLGAPTNGPQADAAHQALKLLHAGALTDVDFNAPASMFEPGWFLRQEIIWAKPNPMPESARDRCTKAHEHVFLLTKSERYVYDFDAMQEPVSGGANARGPGNKTHKHTAAYEAGAEEHRTKAGLVAYAERQREKKMALPAGWATGDIPHTAAAHQVASQHRKVNNGVGFGHGFDAKVKSRVVGVNPKAQAASDSDAAYADGKSDRLGRGAGWRVKQNESFSSAVAELVDTRNPRSVWTIPTHPFKGSHFATFPPALAERCITAGCPPGTNVLDPFGGAGTVGLVADRMQRDAILIELDDRSVDMARARITGDSPLFAEVA